MNTSKTSEIIKPLSKGQITIPAQFRKQLGIDESSFLDVTIRDGDLIIRPIKSIPAKYLRSFTKEEVRGFLDLDRK